jgi:hypothetical protein
MKGNPGEDRQSGDNKPFPFLDLFEHYLRSSWVKESSVINNPETFL